MLRRGEIGGKQRTTDNLAILVGAVDARMGVIDLDIVARGNALR
ncbi:MAG: hypothetical protein PHO08_15855 [Methylococcales bacterium]|nr:hypothetical protein [Methylococcales bacterium]